MPDLAGGEVYCYCGLFDCEMVSWSPGAVGLDDGYGKGPGEGCDSDGCPASVVYRHCATCENESNIFHYLRCLLDRSPAAAGLRTVAPWIVNYATTLPLIRNDRD